MLVGIAYDLRGDYLAEGYSEEETAEFDSPATIQALDDAIAALGHRAQRIGNVRRMVERLARGERWDLVFNITEGLNGMGREAQVPAILDAYGIAYTFSDPVIMGLTLHKGLTKRVVRDCGVPTPDFAVIEAEADLARVSLPYPLFAKPVAEGTGKGVTPASRIADRRQLRAVCCELLKRFDQPVLVETFLPGREFTVGIVGTGARAQAIGALEVILKDNAEQGVYSYVNKEECEERVIYRLVDDALAREASTVALAAWRALGCRDAGRIDLRADAAGRVNFIEVNPLAGLHPSHSDLPILWQQAGGQYVDLIRRIVESASTRIGAGRIRHPAPRAAAE
ncbi:MAG: D-alanine--D-alanine ligase [Alphaproteobacteria bacterium]|nr:D-alanine--D-alanine ligase [Alphaproteobacteria bacterium]